MFFLTPMAWCSAPRVARLGQVWACHGADGGLHPHSESLAACNMFNNNPRASAWPPPVSRTFLPVVLPLPPVPPRRHLRNRLNLAESQPTSAYYNNDNDNKIWIRRYLGTFRLLAATLYAQDSNTLISGGGSMIENTPVYHVHSHSILGLFKFIILQSLILGPCLCCVVTLQGIITFAR